MSKGSQCWHFPRPKHRAWERTQRAALQLAADEVAAGSGGVVFGRNALQVANPLAFQ